MYKFKREKQISFTYFKQPLGLQMNPDNRWVKKATMIPWDTIEAEYAKLFPSHTGMPAKPLRMALGSLLIQKQYHYPDEELVEQIRENPYYQYFIGLLLTKREDTTKASIVLSIIAMNIDRLAAMLLRFIQFLMNFGLSYGQLGCF